MNVIKPYSYTGKLNQYYLIATGFLFIALTCVAFNLNTRTDFDLARQEILLRNIGHEVLQQSGDSTSRVLPISKNGDQYQIRFENNFTFQTDSLVQIVKRSLAKSGTPRNYIVNVLNCTGKQVVFGYAIFKDRQNTVVPCSGRKQPKSCYVINIQFENAGLTARKADYLLGSLPLLALIGFVVSRSAKSKPRTSEIESAATNEEVFTLGNTLFNYTNKEITTAGITTSLTVKEARLLVIFARSPQTIIERNRLQKEIWEDEGVIVGRSLDMFISKLRKKLEHDASVRIVNIHGKGYRLEIE